MRIPFIVFGIYLLAFVGCIAGTPGSGVSDSRQYDLASFDSIALKTSGNVNVTIGDMQSVTVTLDDNLIDRVETEVRDGQLIIDVQGWYSSPIGLQVDVVVPELNGLAISGSGQGLVQGLSNASRFDASISGSGAIRASGSANQVAAKISGSGSIVLNELEAATAEATISGSGSIAIHATDQVDAAISGSGRIEVFGGAKVSRAVSGSGDVITH